MLLSARFLNPLAAFADDTWRAAPATNDYNTAGNWVGNTVPTGGATANFGTSNTTSLSISSTVSPGALQFGAGASAYSFTVSPAFDLQLTGAGIVNNSSNAPTLNTNASAIKLQGSATLANANVNLNSNSSLLFSGTSSGGTAAVSSGSNSTVDISGLTSAGTTLGSLSGTGLVVLGSRQLTIGSNNASTTYSGNITDNGNSGGPPLGGSLVKQGSGTLILDAANSYSGGTTISAGTLQLGATGVSSGSIRGAVTINGGILNVANSDISGTNIINNLGSVLFKGSSTAGNAVISNSGFGNIQFFNNSTAGTATISATSQDFTVVFYNSSSAGNSTLAVNGFLTGVVFADTSSGGNARIINNGYIDLSLSTAGRVTAGSIEGFGRLFLGSTQFVVGSNNLSTIFSGDIITVSRETGSLVKVDSGTLMLSGSNSYSGGTTVFGGTLAGTTTALVGNIVNQSIVAFDRQ
ncbi:MAG: autotransporter-associated beta strand repeat-containing protein [Alphaproteobacteria bacterium]|nr:autotransporter-associated beta strand repeat-containing protein [Alphaproteobacteria bacterium]